MFQKELVKPDGRKQWFYSHSALPHDLRAVTPIIDAVPGSPHLRWHPLRGEWVAFASHRQNRTFLPPKGYSPLAVTRSPESPTEMPPGDYEITVFENLFPSLRASREAPPLLDVPTAAANGACEVVVFTQEEDAFLGGLPLERIDLLLEVWGARTLALSERPELRFVMPFENRGVEMGVTLHHPHGQIYAYPFVPSVPARMNLLMEEHWAKNNKCLLADLIEKEEKAKERIVVSEATSVAFVPVCARYPYETWIAPRRPVAWLHELSETERRGLAATLKRMLQKYDALWAKPMPYLLIVYQAPVNSGPQPHFHLHFQIYPPYRTRDRLKYLAGTELGAGMFVNDSLPEEKAAELRKAGE